MHLVVVEVDAGGATGRRLLLDPDDRPDAVQALLDHDIAAFAVGRPAQPELLWDDAWLHLHEAGGGGLTTIALAGLDLALWDLARPDAPAARWPACSVGAPTACPRTAAG